MEKRDAQVGKDVAFEVREFAHRARERTLRFVDCGGDDVRLPTTFDVLTRERVGFEFAIFADDERLDRRTARR